MAAPPNTKGDTSSQYQQQQKHENKKPVDKEWHTQ